MFHEMCIIAGCNRSTTIMVVLLTGQRLELKVDPLINNIRQLMDIANDFIRYLIIMKTIQKIHHRVSQKNDRL